MTGHVGIDLQRTAGSPGHVAEAWLVAVCVAVVALPTCRLPLPFAGDLQPAPAPAPAHRSATASYASGGWSTEVARAFHGSAGAGASAAVLSFHTVPGQPR